MGFGSDKCTRPRPPGGGRRPFSCISSGIATVIQIPGGAIKGTITDLMSHSQFHCTGCVYLDLHGLIFETSICYWQDQPGNGPSGEGERGTTAARLSPIHGSRSTRNVWVRGVSPLAERSCTSAAAHRATLRRPLLRRVTHTDVGGGRWITAVRWKSAFHGDGRSAAYARCVRGRHLKPSPQAPVPPPVSDL